MVIFSVLNEVNLINDKEEQQENILFMSVVFFVLNEDKTSDVKEEHP